MVQIAAGAARHEGTPPEVGRGARSTSKKREILRAAAEVFRRQGLHAAGMREIAAAAGMAVGNLYYYFRDKQALLAFCHEDALEGLQVLAERVRALPLLPDEQIWTLLVGHMLRLHEATPGALAHLEVDAFAPEAREAVHAQRDRYEAFYRELIREGTSSGRFRDVDPKIAAATLLGALNWTAQWYRPGGGRGARAVGEEMAELLVRGLLALGASFKAPGLPPEVVAAATGE